MARIIDKDEDEINEINEDDFLKTFEQDVKDRTQDLKIEDVEREPEQVISFKEIEKKRYNSAKFAIKRANDVLVMICEIIAKTSDADFAMDEDEINSYSDMLKDYFILTESSGIKPEYLLMLGAAMLIVRKLYKAYKIRRSDQEQDELAAKIKEIEDLQTQLTEQAKQEKKEIVND